MRQLSGGEKFLLVILGGEVRFDTHPRWTLYYWRFSGLFVTFSLILALIATLSGSPPTTGLRNLIVYYQGSNSSPLATSLGPFFFDALFFLFLCAGLGIGLVNLNRLAKRRFRMLRIEEVLISSPLPWR